MLRLLLFLLLPLLAGCVAPIGAVRSSPQQALAQIQGRTSSLRELSGYTRSILRRYDQETRFKNQGQPATIEEVRRSSTSIWQLPTSPMDRKTNASS